MPRTPTEILGNAPLRLSSDERKQLQARARTVLQQILAVPTKKKPPVIDQVAEDKINVLDRLLANDKKHTG